MDQFAGGGLEGLRTRLLENNRWSGCTGGGSKQIPFAPEFWKRQDDIHRSETSRSVSAGSQVSSASEDLCPEGSCQFGFEPLREGSSNETTQHVPAATGGKTGISCDDGEDRRLSRGNDRWYALEQNRSA